MSILCVDVDEAQRTLAQLESSIRAQRLAVERGEFSSTQL